MTKKKTREALFVRIKKANKDFVEVETKRVARTSASFVTNQDTVDRLIQGYRKLKKASPKVAARFF